MAGFTRGFQGRGHEERDPRLPPGQYDAGTTWPVLTAEATPRMSHDQWTFTIEGLVGGYGGPGGSGPLSQPGVRAPLPAASDPARLYAENQELRQLLAEIAARSRRKAGQNPSAQLRGGELDVEKLLAEPYVVSPLRKHDCAPISDGAAAVVLAAGDRARKAVSHPAWIRGIDHRIEAHSLGVRDLCRSPSTALAAREAGALGKRIDVAELHAPFSHQEVILRNALELGPEVDINPSGGALAAHPMMVAGLLRVGEAASRILDGSARRAVAHATSGPCLQQNLVCLLEGDP